MSDFKFSCPACKQNILCDTASVGKEINCPHCQALIIVPPQAFANISATTLPSGTPGGPAPTPKFIPPAVSVQKTSGLAIASLVCSLASLVTCIGWIPGIICGHIAKSSIRKNPSLKGSGIATAGLLIGYLIFASEVGYAGFFAFKVSKAVKQTVRDVQNNLATNQFVTVETTTNPPDDTQPDFTNVMANNTSTDPNWFNDPDKMSFPDHAVSGKIHGNDFQLRRAVKLLNGIRLVSANRVLVEIHGLGDSFEGKSFEVHPTDAPAGIPHVTMNWPEGAIEPAATITRGFAMKLEFGQASNGTVPGKIYLCFPDNSKSWVAGTFEVKLGQ